MLVPPIALKREFAGYAGNSEELGVGVNEVEATRLPIFT
jgi:hypothetical protein